MSSDGDDRPSAAIDTPLDANAPMTEMFSDRAVLHTVRRLCGGADIGGQPLRFYNRSMFTNTKKLVEYTAKRFGSEEDYRGRAHQLYKNCLLFSGREPAFSILGSRISQYALSKNIPEFFFDNLKKITMTEEELKKGAVPGKIAMSRDWETRLTPTEISKLNRHFANMKYDASMDGIQYSKHSISYTLRDGDTILERPHHVIARVACVVGNYNYDSVVLVFDMLARRQVCFGSPTLFNAMTLKGQLASCFLHGMSDSTGGICKTNTTCAYTSKGGGGNSICVSGLRANGTPIHGSNGISHGPAPFLKGFQSTAQAFDQSGKRKGSTVVYVDITHPDCMEVLNTRMLAGQGSSTSDVMECPDLTMGVWTHELFFERLNAKGRWTFFNPYYYPDLYNCYGEEYEDLYKTYEERDGDKLPSRPAMDIWEELIRMITKKSGFYMLNGDACNRRSNHNNMGTIRSSNLCAEIVQYSDGDMSATCNLGSMVVDAFIDPFTDAFMWKEFSLAVRIMVRSLNSIIDVNKYIEEIPQLEKTNLDLRPMGLGIMGLGDAFNKLKIPFESEDARLFMMALMEVMYTSAMLESIEMSKKHGAYAHFNTSMLSKGIMQPDLYYHDTTGAGLFLNRNTIVKTRPVDRMLEDESYVDPKNPEEMAYSQARLRWGVPDDVHIRLADLRELVMVHGAYNSLLLAFMPTASTARYMGRSEATEAYMSCLNAIRLQGSEYIQVNPHLVEDLHAIGKWDNDAYNHLIKHKGSVQEMDIPDALKDVYKTIWEIKTTSSLRLSRIRQYWLCQSESYNMYIRDQGPNAKMTVSQTLSKALVKAMYHNKQKTGLYYLHTRGEDIPIDLVSTDPLADGEDDKTQHANDSIFEEDEKGAAINPETKSEPEFYSIVGSPKRDIKENNFVCRKEEGCTGCD